MHHSVGLVFVMIISLALSIGVPNKCAELGEQCSKTIFQRCCGNYVCDLKTAFEGVCVKCYPLEHGCMSDEECCSGRCHVFQCKPRS
ncbi:hypothetical protein AHF37_08079 [Paragonimus kellicotti]|nr:hypothetical protein AHF37_08079 [Paragonimus kellicotti]